MAPKEDKQPNRRDVAVDATPHHAWPNWRLIQEVQIVDQGSPQPDDELKMEQLAAAVLKFPDFADLWGLDGIPPNGYPADDSRQALHHFWLHFLLWKAPEQDIDTPQKLRIWDMLQNKYNF